MFGWEYPPHVYGGLATANFGISQGLHAQGDVETVLCLPHPFGDEDRSACRIVAMNCVPIAWRDVDYEYVKSRVSNVMDPDYYYRLRDHIYADFNNMHVNDLGCMEFAGGYPSNLHEEINNYSIIAGVVARTEEFDIIHAHDWLTYPAGIHAKHVSGKPLCIHVHATDFDRSRGKVNPTVYAIEKDGMDNADCIMCVSELTRQTVINQYHQDPRKCFTMHNAVYPLRQELQDIPRPDHTGKDKVVTFLGRITMQKGPEYFVEAANMVLQRTRNVRFCMAGSGDMMDAMIYLAAERGIADRFHFPGFMRGKQVYECLKDSVYTLCLRFRSRLVFRLSKRCSAERLPLYLSSLVVPRFSTTVSRLTIGISTHSPMPSMQSAITTHCSTICRMRARMRSTRLHGRRLAHASRICTSVFFLAICSR